MKKIPEITKAINDLKRFTGNASPTTLDILGMVLHDKGLFSIEFEEVDNETVRKRGCNAYGGCACTGHCNELVPVTEIDRMIQQNYLKVVEFVTTELETNLEAYTNG